MVRGKVQMKRIENATSRQVTFSKRRNGIMKKAYELSVLCDAEVAVIIFSQKGRLYEFSSSSMQKTIERYRENTKEPLISNNSIEMEHHMEHLKEETANIAKKIEILEVSKRKLMGQGIGSCSMNELQEIDSQLEKSLKNIRARKTQLLKDEIERLKAKEKQLLEENERLSEEMFSPKRTGPLSPILAMRRKIGLLIWS
ncbi:MADS-box protein AGL42-like isoform X4 [Nicotiana sylvestris]|uniref:MADS-box protein AGL42-like isoform X4 n=1 Tax=Nicotiana sylvestris TaxID=4096 RepID=UPI00388CD5F6